MFPIAGCPVSYYYYYVFIEISIVNANCINIDQMPHSAASDLGLHCLPIPFRGIQTEMGLGINLTEH